MVNSEVINLFCTYSSLGIARFLPIYFQLFVISCRVQSHISKIKITKNQPCEITCSPLCLCLCSLHRPALQLALPLATFSPLTSAFGAELF